MNGLIGVSGLIIGLGLFGEIDSPERLIVILHLCIGESLVLILLSCLEMVVFGTF